MYGMVNNALQEFVSSHLGEDAWLQLAADNDAEDGIFISLESYPDEVTFALAVGAARAMELELDTFLVGFGRHWISYANHTAYAPLLLALGGFSETLLGLDDMHRRIQRTLPKLNAPSFRFQSSPRGGTLRYISTRNGLAPFVVGLLQGLAEMHSLALTINHTIKRTADSHFDEFELEFQL